jgi:nucleotide-binding universal stress UspA family protein
LSKDRKSLKSSLFYLTARIGAGSVPHLLEGDSLDEIERLVLELDADAVVLGRDDGGGTLDPSFAERLFCRIDRSVLLVAPSTGPARSRVNPRAPSTLRASNHGA